MHCSQVTRTDASLILVSQPASSGHPLFEALRAGVTPSDHRLPGPMAELLEELDTKRPRDFSRGLPRPAR
jgi:hypothetical protein